MANDAPRPPDAPPPPVPRPPDAAKQAGWHAGNEAGMIRRPEQPVPADLKQFQIAMRVVPQTFDARRLSTDNRADPAKIRADFAPLVKQLADERRASGSPGGVRVDVTLTHVATWREAQA